MAKQYYCEYCLRLFRDTLPDRRKHRQSRGHRQAKVKYEFDCLEKLTQRFGFENLALIFSVEDLAKLNEILIKNNSCKYHFASSDKPSTNTSIKCKYGLFCKNSHQLNDQQIEECRNYFLEILSSRWTKDNLITFIRENDQSKLQISKRQLRKEHFLNIWLEKRFGLDNRSDLIANMLIS